MTPTARSATFYELLQVHPQASGEVIQAAYRVLARSHHPDHNAEGSAGGAMRELNAAYEVLSDPRRRARYDAHLTRAGRLRYPGATTVRASPAAHGRTPSTTRGSHSTARGSRARGLTAIAAISVLVAVLTLVLWLAYDAVDDGSPYSGQMAGAAQTFDGAHQAILSPVA